MIYTQSVTPIHSKTRCPVNETATLPTLACNCLKVPCPAGRPQLLVHARFGCSRHVTKPLILSSAQAPAVFQLPLSDTNNNFVTFVLY